MYFIYNLKEEGTQHTVTLRRQHQKEMSVLGQWYLPITWFFSVAEQMACC